MTSHGDDSHSLALLVGGTIVAFTEARYSDHGEIRLLVRTAGGRGVRVHFTGVSTRVLENVGRTVIADVRELPAPAPWRQIVFVAEPDRMPRTIKIVAKEVQTSPEASLDAPVG
jgi:hypothetical protein